MMLAQLAAHLAPRRAAAERRPAATPVLGDGISTNLNGNGALPASPSILNLQTLNQPPNPPPA